MNSYFADMIQRQVEQFNREIEESVSFHKDRLGKLCVERLMQEHEALLLHDQQASKRYPQPASFAHAVLQLSTRACNWVVRRVIPNRNRQALLPTGEPAVINGEYRVIDVAVETLVEVPSEATDKVDT